MDKNELKQLLPHRGPMLLIDEASLISPEHSVGSVKIRGDEWFVQGHFPGNPIVPGVVLCEMIAQTCCITVLKERESVTPYFTGMNKLRFLGVVRPGDTVRFDCQLTASRPPFYFARAKGFVGDTECVSGEFSFAVQDNV